MSLLPNKLPKKQGLPTREQASLDGNLPTLKLNSRRKETLSNPTRKRAHREERNPEGSNPLANASFHSRRPREEQTESPHSKRPRKEQTESPHSRRPRKGPPVPRFYDRLDLGAYENYDTSKLSQRDLEIVKANFAINKILVELTNLGYRNMAPKSVEDCLQELNNSVRQVNIVVNKLKDAYRILLKKSILNTDQNSTETLLIADRLFELQGPQNIGFFNSFFGRKRTMLNKILLAETEELVCNAFSKDDSYSTVEIVKFAKNLGCVKGPIPKIVRGILKKHGLNFSGAYKRFLRDVEYLCNKISTK